MPFPSIITSAYGEQAAQTAVTHTVAITYTPTGNNLVYIVAHSEDSGGTPTIDSAAFDGQAMTAISASVVEGANDIRAFYILDADITGSGSKNAVVTYSSDDAVMQLEVVHLSNAKQQSPESENSATDTVTDAITVDLSGVSANSRSFCGVGCGDDRTWTEGASQTEQWDENYLSQSFHGSYEDSSGTVTMSATASASANRIVITAFAFVYDQYFIPRTSGIF